MDQHRDENQLQKQLSQRLFALDLLARTLFSIPPQTTEYTTAGSSAAFVIIALTCHYATSAAGTPQPFLSIFRSRARESQYDICVGFSNETKHFFVFFIRKAQSHTLTSMMETTSALRRSNEQQFPALLYLE